MTAAAMNAIPPTELQGQPTMLDHTTIEQLRALKLEGFAAGLEEQMRQPNLHGLSFEERLALLVDREVHARSDRRQTRLLQKARLKYPHAAIEDVDSRAGRGIDRKAFMSLALSDWIGQGATILFTGATGLGKSWLACALGQYACRRGHATLYLRVPRLAEELRVLHGSGGFGKWLVQLAKTDVVILDDWALTSIDAATRGDLLEIIDDRAGHAGKATILTTQLPVEHWHAWIGDATIADAILDRLMQRVHRVNLTGPSLRDTQAKATTKKAVPQNGTARTTD
jgi:DNA replication protein DnaC